VGVPTIYRRVREPVTGIKSDGKFRLMEREVTRAYPEEKMGH
jgi:hypothetical protein